ncbi:NAD(P)-dependent oxidoreductase [Terricaulis silvestris]|uniref:NADH-flavin reductase n=1 Tax=Terricaulis silvestris TaxID=2686094 RepID=A0A6I6MM52_9CAUL|nr:NAD(P)H-binding protein [Terricaulis silvestris]QGZ93797.1 Putative NADH-flavin reductase [Terricaulis silvestris]
MNVVIIGATGKAAARLISELTRRAHAVRGLARHVEGADIGIPLLQVDANDRAALAHAVRGADAVFLSARFVSVQSAPVIGAMQDAGVRRLLVVGGAGSLEVSPGVQLLDTPTFPDVARPESQAGRTFLAALKASDLDWTFLSPPLSFGPGDRTGTYRLGGDQLMRDDSGASAMSYEDFAKALVDELETSAHTRRRFTIAY